MFTPQDQLSRQLLESIPKKMVAWLSELGQLTSADAEANVGKITCTVSGKTGTLTFATDPDPIIIEWTDTSIVGNREIFEHVSANLDVFVSIENMFYQEMEKFAETVTKKVCMPDFDVPDAHLADE